MSARQAMSDRASSGAAAVAAIDPERGRALLQIWLSPAFPVGGFAYSHGLEKAVERGWVSNEAGLEAWLADLVAQGSLRNDLILLAAAWRGSRRRDGELKAAAELAHAMQPSSERAVEAGQQGASFLAQIAASWPAGGIDWAQATGDAPPTYAVAVGHVAAAHGIALKPTLEAYAIAFLTNLASAAIRLGVLGQTGAQRVTASLLGRLQAAAALAEASDLGDIGGAAWRSDIASMQHETQHTRLFRS